MFKWLTDGLTNAGAFGTPSISDMQTTGDAADAKLRELNEKRYKDGLIGPEEYRQRQKNANDGATGDVSEQVYSEFKAGITGSAPWQVGINLGPILAIVAAAYLLLLLKE